MRPTVEPVDGPEIDRFITALLNVTGVVRRIVEEEDGDRDPGVSGEEVIGCCAERLHAVISAFSYLEDDELARMTEFLAITSVLVAQHLGCAGVFQEEWQDRARRGLDR